MDGFGQTWKPPVEEAVSPQEEEELVNPPEPKVQPQKPIAKKAPGYDQQIMGKYLLRDMPLFKYEMIVYMVAVLVSVFLAYLSMRGILADIAGKVILPIAILPLAFWFVKWFMYMPRRNKVPSLRIYKSGTLELGIDDISKGWIPYGRGENMQRKYITKLTKHTEASTGKPFLVTSELEGENLDLIHGSKPDMRSEEFNAILEMNTSVTTKNVMNKMMRFTQPGLNNPMFLLSALTIALLVVVLAKDFGLFEMI